MLDRLPHVPECIMLQPAALQDVKCLLQMAWQPYSISFSGLLIKCRRAYDLDCSI